MRKVCLFILVSFMTVITSCDTNGTDPNSPSSKKGGKSEVSFTFPAGDMQYASLRETVTLDVKSSANSTLSINWGDGSTDSGAVTGFTHKYTVPGKYTVKAEYDGSQKEWKVEIGSIPVLSEAINDLYNTPGKVWVMAHRSHTTDQTIPENSIPAIRAAIAAGADVIETDTHRTMDGKIVVSHDESIDKHTTGSGKITAMTLSEIQKYNLLDRNGGETNEVIPTLEEFLKAARGKVYVNLDFSNRTASTKEVLKVVESLGMVQEVFMYCGDANSVKDVFRNNPEANAYVRSEDYLSLAEGKNRYFLQVGWNSGQSQQSECVIRCKEAYNSGVLCSVNLLNVNHSYIPEYSIDSGQLSSLFNLYPECQMIQTDCPREMIKILKEQGRR